MLLLSDRVLFETVDSRSVSLEGGLSPRALTSRPHLKLALWWDQASGQVHA
jgi:hypothetical protein